MTRGTVTGFLDSGGEWRELHDPNGPPTPYQLVALHRAGVLRLVMDPDDGNCFSKAEAAWLIDRLVASGHIVPRRRLAPAERFDRVCRAILVHVRAHPGCSTTSVVRAVGGNRAYTGFRIRDLLELGALVDRARRRGPGRARELWVPNNDAAGDAAERSTP